MNQASKTYVWQFGGSMALYSVVIVVSMSIVRSMPQSPLRYLAALLPVLPIILALLAFLNFFRKMDEMQKRIQMEAMAASFAATGLLTFTYGLLDIAGLPQLSMVYVFPLMIFLWGFATAFASRRYQ